MKKVTVCAFILLGLPMALPGNALDHQPAGKNCRHKVFFPVIDDGSLKKAQVIAAAGIWTGTTSSDWNTGSNWDIGTVPVATTTVLIPAGTPNDPSVSSADAEAGSLTISSGATLTLAGIFNITISNSGSFTNDGTFNCGSGTGAIIFSGSGTINGASSTVFNNLSINGNLTLSTTPTINGNFLINGGTVSAAPIYGSNSTLIYNTVSPAYTVGKEWSASTTTGTAGAGNPQNVSIQNVNVVMMPNGDRRAPGNLTISAGGLTLNSNANKDLYIGGNFTNNGVFTHNNRKVTFNASIGSQVISGNTVFYDLTEDNSAATLDLGSAIITIDNILRVNAGIMEGNTSTVIFTGSAGSIAGSNNKNFYNLQINNGANISDMVVSAGNITVANDYVNNGTFTQHNAHTISFNKSGAAETISGTGFTTFGKVTIGGPSFSFPTTLNSVSHDFIVAGNTFQFNKSNSSFTGTNCTVTFDATSGTCTLKNNTSVTGTSANFFNVTLSNGTNVTLGTDVSINNIFNIAGIGNSVTMGSNTLTLNGTVTGNGTFIASTSSNLTIGGTAGGSVGLLSFSAGAQKLNNFTINRTGISSQVDLGSDLSINNNLTLTSGIVTTGDHLLTWNNGGGTLTNTSPYSSYICLCNNTGTNPVTFDKPYDGTRGFRINNVGNTDTYFPVGVDLISPNRLYLKNMGTADNITVALEKGDIGNTIDPRVNRIWYLHQMDTTKHFKADMKLYFTKRTDFQNWPNAEDEIEPGFTYGNVRLVQKDYSGNVYFINESAASDVKSYGVTDGTEIYAQYTVGISTAYDNTQNGITQFNKFSIIDGSNIILPVTITNINAWQDGKKVKVEWISKNELNISRYEIERASDAQHFMYLGNIQATNNNYTADYQFTDIHPATGKNYYRIKVIDKSGSFSYTSIVMINISNGIERMLIYPNPIKHRLNLQLDNVDKGFYTLEIYDETGRLGVRKKIEHPGGRFTQQIVLPSGIVAGVYKVILLSNDDDIISRGSVLVEE